jgi:NADH:ubiquinone oxidoreductase subunit B-like Fe-S oxidoreductase
MKPTPEMLMKAIRRLDNQIEHRADVAERAQLELDALLAERKKLAKEYAALTEGEGDE